MLNNSWHKRFNDWRETYNLRFLLTCFLETWYFYAIALSILFLTLAIGDKLEQDQVKVKNDTNNSKINHEPRRRGNEAFAESYDLGVKSVPDTAAIHPSFEENRPEQLIAPESFGKTYDYYIDNLELYFANENGKIYQIPTRGMAVKIGSPVRSVVYLSNSKPIETEGHPLREEVEENP